MPQPIMDVHQSPTSANGHSLASNGHPPKNGISLAQSATNNHTRHLDAMDYDDEHGGGGGLSFKALWRGSSIDRRELVRLALQTFDEMGYTYAPLTRTLA